MKKIINAFDYASDICNAMKKGILLSTAADGKVNTMTIGWGFIGVEWGKPIFVALVRESRHTHEMLSANAEFTVNIPYGEVDGRILGFCGTKSGRDVDKVRELGLHLEDSMNCSVPGIRELPLTLECKVIYRQDQDLSAIPAPLLEKYYPQGETRHTAYYGEIVGAYLITE